jgi:hypothetical protein
MNKYGIADIGCYVDGARGIYAGEAVQEIAASHAFGWYQGYWGLWGLR